MSMAKTVQEEASNIINQEEMQLKKLNAETVTAIATNFLKRIGNKGRIDPKRVSLEEGTYTVEAEMKNMTAIIRVDSETAEIKEYEIQQKEEEASLTVISPKIIMIMMGISGALYIALHFAFKIFGL
ncbi:hypothetical protein H5T51_00890 [Candidatus Bathyarchaeota archaeon]|nr:hypothetical protein [Candidatus Bathyarchaeota archaeon]